jgi:TrmH family RNA methyltransferase
MFSKSTIKYIQSLQHKKFRDEYNVFIAEGPKLVKELLQGNKFLCRNIYALQEWVDGLDKHMQELVTGKVEVILDFELSKIAAYTTPNQVVALFEKRVQAGSVDPTGKLILALDGIQDPGNLGTIIRTADWFGIENMICSVNTADMYNSKVVQGTMASLGNVNMLYTDLAVWLRGQGRIQKIATTLNGKPMKAVNGIKEAIIIIGNEANGISPAILELADLKISIPKYGSAESLNAAVATGIILSALRS